MKLSLNFKLKKTTTINEANVGLLLIDREPGLQLLMKTEYLEDGEPLCYIVSTGEKWCAGDKECHEVE